MAPLLRDTTKENHFFENGKGKRQKKVHSAKKKVPAPVQKKSAFGRKKSSGLCAKKSAFGKKKSSGPEASDERSGVNALYQDSIHATSIIRH